MYNREFYGNNDAAIHLIHRTYYTRAKKRELQEHGTTIFTNTLNIHI